MTEQKRYTIGQLARAAGVKTSTVRFYERKGLVRPEGRTAGNYRAYSAKAADRLGFVRSAQATGFSLKDIHEMLRMSESAQRPCAEVTALISRRLEQVRHRLAQMKKVEQSLADSLRTCCQSEDDLCVAIERLKGRDCGLTTKLGRGGA